MGEVAVSRSRATQYLGVRLSQPVSGRHKYTDLVLQVGGWGRGWPVLPVNHQMYRKLKKRRPRANSGQLGHTTHIDTKRRYSWRKCGWRFVWERRTRERFEEDDGDGKWKKKGLGERDEGSRWKQNPLALLCGGPKLRFGVTGTDLNWIGSAFK